MTALNKQAGAGDVNPKTYYIHPAAFGSTKDHGYGHVPVVKADDFENLRAKLEAAEKRIAEHNFENRLLANADRDIKALRERIAELEAVREVFLRAKALMYQSGGAPIENSLNPIDAWLYDAELIAAGIGVKGD